MFKVDFHIDPGWARVVSRSEISGSGYWSFLVTLFSALKSTHNWRLPSFFFTNSTREPQGDLLGHMKPFWIFSPKVQLTLEVIGSRLVHRLVLPLLPVQSGGHTVSVVPGYLPFLLRTHP